MAQSNKKKETHFVLTYRDPRDGQIVALKCRTIRDSSLGLSFIMVSDFIFETEGVVVNPVEEQLKKRFENVKSLHLSISSIVSIEEMGAEHKGLTFEKDKSNLVVLPGSTPAPK